MKAKSADEQIKEFIENKKQLEKKGYLNGWKGMKPKSNFRWFQIPVYFALIVGLSSLMLLPFLLVLALLKYLGVI